LEEALIPTPLFSNPLEKTMLATPTSKLKGSSNLLTSCRGYVEKNIKKIMELITEAWETSQNIASFQTRENDLHENLQANLKNEERFYLQTMIPFGNHVINISDMKRIQEDLPSPNQIKQLKACSKEKVKNLHLIVKSREQAISEK
jgi:alpha-mannosidase